MSHLEGAVLCREAQVSALQALFGERHHFSFPSIFIYGHTASGKTYVTQTLLKTLELPHVFVNCVECFTLRLLLEQILNKLSRLNSSEAECPTEVTCETFNDFVRLFKQVTNTENLKDQTVYIVLDKAEYLRDMEANLLPGFLRLQELTDRNVTVIFLSEIIWEKFRPNTGCFEPFVLYFPDYSIGNLQKILSHDHPPEYSADFYAAYINILLGVFYTVCRDLKELRHLAVLNFPKYCEPVVKGEAGERDTRKLWRNIEPHLKKAMQTVYLREISSSQWEKLQKDDTDPGQLKGLSAYTHVELPYYSKFILIAAYLASYNPARTDRRFFLKHHGKIKKTNFLKKHEKTSNHLLGPKPFPLDRLLAILYSIVDSRVAPTANIFSQITSLVTLQLLTIVGHDDQLDGPKYKCTVSLDFIRAIARTVNFDIIKYLYDFL
ncbi:origin recognition complex subunit 5 [Cricetulus griseus]|uniref:Origin recognition complex subunit 5 n=1 Tax=Cricetulus griseus TaxID=10029 RepID=Q4U3P9_CRIGR|nr:origin recognition complex subunit 5 [Cricetulus griseus]AAY41170.1 origin recognition complex subunit 5 [Cricetulus griseus]EGV97014.1 Origin recognition complex subunit 5 [Cricetulus griseus]BAE16572.1 Origin Recognition Complex subunit 5 [Cricetulus griseus]